MRTGLRFRRTVAADDGCGGGGRSSSSRSRTTDPDQHWVHRARLHLTAADDSLGPAAGAAAGFTAAAAALRALVHVQLARLHGAAATGRGTATPGTLYASPHPLHSTTGVRLTIGRPTPSPIRRIARARDRFDPLRATSVVLDYVALWGMKPPLADRRDARWSTLPPSRSRAADDVPSHRMRVGARTNPGVYPERKVTVDFLPRSRAIRSLDVGTNQDN